MLFRSLGLIAFACLLLASRAAADAIAPAGEQPLESRLASVGLFKNGLAVLRREATLDKPGTYRLDKVPDPIHGTFWVESTSDLETQVQARDVEVPFAESGAVELEGDLVGKAVTLHFYQDKLTPLKGTVLERKKGKSGVEGSDAAGEDGRVAPRPQDDFLVLLTEAKKLVYVRASAVVFVETAASEKLTRKKPVLLLKVGAGAQFPLKVQISYLARGLSWAPSYRVDISDPKTLKIEQATVVRNELTELKDVEVQLISGFPSVQLGHVKSPMAANATWARFFAELASDGGGYRRGGQMMMAQQVASNAYFRSDSEGGGALPELPGGDGIDLHYQSIGERSLGLNSSISLTVAKATADYERIVEWLVPDTRDAHGSQQRQNPTDDDEPWDALKFKNPFKFPMTSAPAFVVSGGKFGGQRLSTWVSPSEETLLRVNKSLSIRTRSIETEVQNGSRAGLSDREVIWVGGQRYRQANVDGELTICNHRKEEVKMQIRRRFSGELQKADADPKVTLREEGVWSVNRRNELRWDLKLKPGVERKLTYKYTVLVSF